MRWVTSVLWNGCLLVVDDRGQVWSIVPDWEFGFVGQKVAMINRNNFASEEALIDHLKGYAEFPF